MDAYEIFSPIETNEISNFSKQLIKELTEEECELLRGNNTFKYIDYIKSTYSSYEYLFQMDLIELLFLLTNKENSRNKQISKLIDLSFKFYQEIENIRIQNFTEFEYIPLTEAGYSYILRNNCYNSNIDGLKKTPGIYFLYNLKKELIYIGKSKNLNSRINTSVREKGAFYFSYWILQDKQYIEIVENCLICLNIENKKLKNKQYIKMDKKHAEMIISETPLVDFYEFLKPFDIDYNLINKNLK